ncbi:MAG: TRAM domain-containing protein, partial [Pseudobdellovibrio sp.]
SSLESLLHSEHIVDIEKLVVGGDALARIQYQDKSLVVFIPLAAPREKLKIKITQVEKNHLYGEIVDIIEASSARREAPCEYFTSCGGCSWQHITEAEQIAQKELILTDLLKKFIPEANYKLLPTITSEKNLNYRNRIQLKQLGSELGYFKKGSHQIVDINRCLIAEKEISDKIPDLKKTLRPSAEIKKFELRINHLNQFEHYPIGGDGEGLSFSQVNNEVNSRLVSTSVDLIKSLNPQFLSELYAGAGNFTFPLIAALPELRIESVEMNSKLTAFSTKKLTDLKLQKRLFAFTSDCESFVERRELSKELILLDPPRSGCSDTVIDKVIAADSKNLLYISCHPVFLARDLKKLLISNPEYKISHLQIFDMFPQTDHFETLVLLSK